MDLCLRYKGVELGIELKVWRDKIGDPEKEGLEQLDSYLARIEVNSGWLVIFDRRSKAPKIEERLSTKTTTTKNGRSIIIVRAQVIDIVAPINSCYSTEDVSNSNSNDKWWTLLYRL